MLNNLIDQLLPNKSGIKIPSKSFKTLMDLPDKQPFKINTSVKAPNPFPKDPKPLVPFTAKDINAFEDYDTSLFAEPKEHKPLRTYFNLPDAKLDIPSDNYWLYGGYKQAGKNAIERGLDHQDVLVDLFSHKCLALVCEFTYLYMA